MQIYIMTLDDFQDCYDILHYEKQEYIFIILIFKYLY